MPPVCMKGYSSLVRIISDGENNFMQNICNTFRRYRNILPNRKNNLVSSTIYLLEGMIEIANSKLIIKT